MYLANTLVAKVVKPSISFWWSLCHASLLNISFIFAQPAGSNFQSQSAIAIRALLRPCPDTLTSMPRRVHVHCIVCTTRKGSFNTNGLCEKCAELGRIKAASKAGKAGIGKCKVRKLKNKRCLKLRGRAIRRTRLSGTGSLSNKSAIFVAMIQRGMNPKAFMCNIHEYKELQTFCRAARRCSVSSATQAFLLARGIRGVRGIAAAKEFWKSRKFKFNDKNLKSFAAVFRGAWRKAGGRTALAHKEHRHHLFSGWQHVKLFSTCRGRQQFLDRARTIQPLFKKGRGNGSSAFDVAAMTRAMKGYRLSAHGTAQRST